MATIIEKSLLERAITAVLRRRYPGHLFEGAKLLVDDLVATPFSEGPAVEDRIRLMMALLEMAPLSRPEIAQSVKEIAPEKEDGGCWEGYMH